MKRASLFLIIALLLGACNSSPSDDTIPPTAAPTVTAESEVESSTPETDVVEEIATDDESEDMVVEESAEDEGGESAEDTPMVAFDPDADPLILAFIPQENPEKLLGDITQITAYLEGELGIPVEGYVTQDHAAAVEALRNGEADVSFMGALPYILARDQVGAEVILSEVYRGSPVYTSRIFVRADSGIETLADLEGKSIAFADPISESGYLYPLDNFVQAGLFERGADPQTFFSTVFFAGGYQQSIQAVLNGYVDAAGASQFAELLVPPNQLTEIKWIHESEPIPAHAVIVRPELDADLVERLKQAMLKLNQPDYQHLLQYVYSPDGYVEASHEDYVPVEEIARQYELID